MPFLQPEIHCQEQSVLRTLLDATEEISYFLRHSPVIVLETQNKFGDQQLHQDVQCDGIIQKHLKKNPLIKGFASEERPHYQELAQGDGYVITYDPLDGSSIIDTNFAIGSIFSIWKTGPNRLIGDKLSSQVNAMITVYGPRTTAIFYNSHFDKVQELTLIEKEWIVSHQHCIISPKTKIFSPGNLRSASDNEEYLNTINTWMRKAYTLRYTGGLVVDVSQIFIKGNGIFSCVGSKNHKPKLRALYEAAALGFLVEKAEGKTITSGKVSILDYEIKSYDDRMPFAVGSGEQIELLAHLF